MEAYSGRQVDLLMPCPSQISIDDIAHHLSQINRFNGATSRPYSVAQHSIYVSMLVPDEIALFGLLHDAHEAYLGDLNTPLKNALCDNRISLISKRMDLAICAALGLRMPTDEECSVIKRADMQAMADEKEFLKPYSKSLWSEYGLPPPAGKINVVFSHDEARLQFLNVFWRLYDRSSGLQTDTRRDVGTPLQEGSELRE